MTALPPSADPLPAPSPRPAVFVVGAGRLGTTVLRALHAVGWPIAGVWSRSTDVDHAPCPVFIGALPTDAIAAAPVVLFAVPDHAIRAVSGHTLTAHHIALHTSGATPSSVLRHDDRPRAAGSWHPLQSFSSRFGAPEHLHGVAIGLEGDDEAVLVGRALANAVGGAPFRVHDADMKALYHAACCTVSNGLVALAHRAVDLFEAAGLSRQDAVRALAPLISGTASNLAGSSTPEHVLTGPIARGDVDVVKTHLATIARHLPDGLTSYRHLCDEIARTANRDPAPWAGDNT